MATDRMRRVDEAVREVLGASVATDLKDPRIGFVTVTDVKTSPDLRHARVYVSVLGTPAEQDASLTGLQSAHGFLQAGLARQLRMKHTPALTFILDDTAEKAQRVERIMGSSSPSGSDALGGSSPAARNAPAPAGSSDPTSA